MLITLNPDNSFASLQKWDDLSPAIADFTGPFVPVLDGDTIEVLHNTHAERDGPQLLGHRFSLFTPTSRSV